MSDDPRSDVPNWGWSAPADMQWHLPPSRPPEPPAGSEPVARSASGFTVAIAAIVAAAMAAFVAGGFVRSRSAGLPAALRIPSTPLFDNSSSSPAPAPVTGSSGLSASAVASIAAKVSKGVVDINTELGYQHGSAAGTGMVLTPSGEVLTNNHVVQGATKITVTVVDTGKTYSAHVVGTDPSDDVAVLQVQGASGLKTVAAAPSSSAAIGDSVVAVGNAGGRGGAPTAVAGLVVALGQTITATDENGANAERLTDLIQIDAAIESGDSGGPLVNRNGEVIGMDSAAEAGGPRLRSDATYGYAIPIDKAISIAQQIASGKASSTVHIGLPAFLGVQMAGGAARGAGARNAAPGSGGALVAGVEQGTPAADIGLAAGDTITSVNGQAVGSPSALTTALQGTRPGDQVAIGWTDQAGAQHSARATLATGPAD